MTNDPMKRIRDSLYDILHHTAQDEIQPHIRHRLAVLLDIATTAAKEKHGS